MFEKAITAANQFTRPIYSVTRTYKSTDVEPGCATLFFVNSDGWALTCKHVAQLLAQANTAADHYKKFKEERSLLTKTKKLRTVLPGLEKKYGITTKHTVELKFQFMDCVEGALNLQKFDHPDVDLSLLKFSKFSKLHCTQFPMFPKDTSTLMPGKMICRLGYPFPEFQNFQYNTVSDEIEWTTTGRQNTPMFPLDGMVTRQILGSLAGKDAVIGFELSTPGLRGQSGGPAFDTDGKIWGIQSATNHLYLGFDVKKDIRRDGKNQSVSHSAFLHVGHVIHVDVIKEFMRANSVVFQEA